MVVVADTCSLVALSRYYSPFDNDNQLSGFLEKSFNSRKLLLLDSIHKECSYIAQGLVFKNLPFLNSDKKLIINTSSLVPPAPQRFSNQLDNNLAVMLEKKKMTEIQYIQAKQEFLETGDAKIIIYALNERNKNSLLVEDLYVLTEEKKNQNDGKLFKKLPTICEFFDIKVITLPNYLKLNNINIDWSIPDI